VQGAWAVNRSKNQNWGVKAEKTHKGCKECSKLLRRRGSPDSNRREVQLLGNRGGQDQQREEPLAVLEKGGGTHIRPHLPNEDQEEERGPGEEKKLWKRSLEGGKKKRAEKGGAVSKGGSRRGDMGNMQTAGVKIWGQGVDLSANSYRGVLVQKEQEFTTMSCLGMRDERNNHDDASGDSGGLSSGTGARANGGK